MPGAGRPAWRQAGDMTNDTAVRVSGLRKRYGDTCAVDGVELEIGRGEVFALLGPNGAGKTTTVEILEGFRRRDGGDGGVLGPTRAPRAGAGGPGSAWSCRPPPTRPISPSPRWSGTLPGSTRGRGRSGRGDAHGRADREGRRAGSAPCPAASGAAVDVALGVVGRPELLFLDEPTTGFDPRGAAAVLGTDPGPRRRGHHDPADHPLPGRGRGARRSAGGLAGGRMVGDGTPGRARRPDRPPGWLASPRTAAGRYRPPTPTQVVAALAADSAARYRA